MSDGKYDGVNRVLSIEDFGQIVARMRELVDDANWVDMEGGYIRASGKPMKRPHALNLDHASEAIKGVINKNSGENSIKKFGDWRISETMGISKQADEIVRMVDEFFPEEMPIRTIEYDMNGVKSEKNSKTTQIKDILTVMKIFERLPASI